MGGGKPSSRPSTKREKFARRLEGANSRTRRAVIGPGDN